MTGAVAILVNGASSSGKSSLCRALQDRLTELADGNHDAAFGLVAFDDIALLLSDRLFPLSLVRLQGGDISRLMSRQRHDGRAAGAPGAPTAGAEGVDGPAPKLGPAPI